MYICGLIPRNFAELAEAVPIGSDSCTTIYHTPWGAWWHSGRVLDLRSKGHWFETDSLEALCCVLEQDTLSSV